FPLADILTTLLDIGQREMNNPIEVEFAANLETPAGTPRIFNFLQLRPIVHSEEAQNISVDHVRTQNTIVFSEAALGNGVFKGIKDIVYIKPESFNPANNKFVSTEIEKLNASFLKAGTAYVLIGPGRWGSTDPWLGIPVKWHQISGARIIIESGLKNYRIDPSQGTHFFQNLTSFRVGYFTINPFISEGYYDVELLNDLPAVYEDSQIRHVRFEEPLEIMIDGRKHKGVIMKPNN
ncbi:MAG TPA: hypothetical protein VK155_15695, partial [Bacteroidales bacterium]|nr:hypothetical protein [Bacteroidales bacterium]